MTTDYDGLARQYESPRIAGLLAPGTPTIASLFDQAGVSALVEGPSADAVDAALRKLRDLLDGGDPLRYMSARSAAVQRLEALKVKYASRLVAAALQFGEEESVPPPSPADADPWPEPVDGVELLDDIRQLIVKHVVLPVGAPEALATMALATHCIDAFNTATYLFLSSPTPECGKTRALEVAELIVRRPWRPAILTGPVLFRGIEAYEPTLLLDEAEVVNSREDAGANVRAVLHVGYRRGATVSRCVGDDCELREFRTFGFKIFAAIGELPGTLLSRCIVVPMRRRTRDEHIARFVLRDLEPVGIKLRRRCRRWAKDHCEGLRDLRPQLPTFLDDRRAEIWEPLFAVATIAGGGWVDRLTRAAAALSGSKAPESVGITLLLAIRHVFTARRVDRLASVDLVQSLNEVEGAPWPDWNHGHGLSANRVAGLLAPFGVAPKVVRIGDKTPRGYLLSDFADAFGRYIPAPPPPQSATLQQAASLLDEAGSDQVQRGSAAAPDMLPERRSAASDVAVLHSGDGGGDGNNPPAWPGAEAEVQLERAAIQAESDEIPLPELLEGDEPDPEGLFSPEAEP